MMKFVLRRPVAVLMISISLIILGIISIFQIPTALMPDVPIPKITIRLSYPNNSARDIETNAVRPLRNQLLQLSNLKDIESISNDGSATIKLTFNFGTNADLAFIETNEKVDASLNLLPRDLERPRVIKASSTDIPILNIAITQEGDYEESFLELSEFTEIVLKKRIEQLPQVAIADITGLAKPEILIQPDPLAMQSLDISHEDLIQVIEENNFNLGNLIVENGIYQYNFRFSDPLKNIDDIENIRFNLNGQLIELSEISTITKQERQKRGSVLYNGEKAILLSVIKQSDAQVSELKENLSLVIEDWQRKYPNLRFHINQDQSQLLRISLSNLQSSLFIGVGLAIFITFFFLKDIRLPLIIATSIPTSLIISFLFLYLSGISINIISLSGMILGVGMMIDNAIIVVDNISQKIQLNENYFDACVSGTKEVISPLISSVLTTCMIFVPLIFLSGITGALLKEQVLAVAIGLSSSLVISIFLIPVLFYRIRNRAYGLKIKKGGKSIILQLENKYEKVFSYFFDRQYLIWSFVLIFLITGICLIILLPKSKLPQFSYKETIMELDWNENISVEESKHRIKEIFESSFNFEEYVAEIGEQQYLLSNHDLKEISQVRLYINTETSKELKTLKKELKNNLKRFPGVTYLFSPPENIFQYIFGDNKERFYVKVYSADKLEVPSPKELSEIRKIIPDESDQIALRKSVGLSINHENLLLYQVSYKKIVDELKVTFDQNFIDNLKSTKRVIPIKLNYEQYELNEGLNKMLVENKNGDFIPAKQLVNIVPITSYKNIHGDQSGEYLKYVLNTTDDRIESNINRIKNKFRPLIKYGASFGGSWFDMKDLGKELLIVVLVSVLLLYLIMAAQFESLTQPIIILLEIPVDIGGGLFLLWLFGGSINIMVAIGVVIMSGIVINDSIIKIHTINMLRKEGYSLIEAIKKGGNLRLKAILMTSLTTVFALLPFLFIDGMGAELQRPLALTVIGGMITGTFLSLYFLPLMYHFLESKNK